MQETMWSLDSLWLQWRSAENSFELKFPSKKNSLSLDDCCLGRQLILRRLWEGRTTGMVCIWILSVWIWNLRCHNFRLDKMLKWSTDYFMAAHKSGGLKILVVVNILNPILWNQTVSLWVRLGMVGWTTASGEGQRKWPWTGSCFCCTF